VENSVGNCSAHVRNTRDAHEADPESAESEFNRGTRLPEAHYCRSPERRPDESRWGCVLQDGTPQMVGSEPTLQRAAPPTAVDKETPCIKREAINLAMD